MIGARAGKFGSGNAADCPDHGSEHNRCAACHRAQQGDVANRVATGALGRVQPSKRVFAALGDDAVESRQAGVAGDIPNRHADARTVVEAEQFSAIQVVNGVEPDAAAFTLRFGEVVPAPVRIAFHYFADAMAGSLQQVVARSQSVGGGRKARQVEGVAAAVGGVDQLVGKPDSVALEPVVTFDPQDRKVRMEAAAGRSGELLDIHYGMAGAHFLITRKLQRQQDALGVITLDRLHHGRSFCGVEVESLALRYGEGSRVGTARHDHRDADGVESGDVGQASYTHLREERLHASQRIAGCD